jgi:hypothetical protein
MRLAVALIAGVVAYAAWYRWQVGPFCPGMWGGTAPPVMIGVVTLSAYRALRA